MAIKMRTAVSESRGLAFEWAISCNIRGFWQKVSSAVTEILGKSGRQRILAVWAVNRVVLQNESESVGAQPVSEIASQVIDHADFLHRRIRDAGNRHREIAGKQHGGERFEHFSSNLFFNHAAGLRFLTLATVQCGAYLALQTLHAAHRETNLDGKSRTQVLEHLIAFSRLGLDQELIDNNGCIRLFAQPHHGLLPGLGPMSFAAGGVFKSGGALLATRRRGYQ